MIVRVKGDESSIRSLSNFVHWIASILYIVCSLQSNVIGKIYFIKSLWSNIELTAVQLAQLSQVRSFHHLFKAKYLARFIKHLLKSTIFLYKKFLMNFLLSVFFGPKSLFKISNVSKSLMLHHWLSFCTGCWPCSVSFKKFSINPWFYENCF